MAHFMGELRGKSGTVSRLGSKSSGLDMVAKAWTGSIRTHLFVIDGVDHVRISANRENDGSGVDRVIYNGPVAGAGA